MKQNEYINSKELEKTWYEYNRSGSVIHQQKLYCMIYEICKGISRKFYPSSDEEHCELSNQAYLMTIEKINRGSLKYTPGKAPVFNLLTTAIFNLLYTYKNSEKRKKDKIYKYINKLNMEM